MLSFVMISFYVAIISCIICIALLIYLAITDHKHYILPNEMVAGLAIFAVIFHVATHWEFITIKDSIIGLASGMGLLMVIRIVANHLMKMEDSVGLGDVKLMGAVGLWLGFPNVMLVFMLGGLFGVFHGIILRYFLLIKAKDKSKVPKLSMINIPAGVGLSIATVVIFFYSFGLWWKYV